MDTLGVHLIFLATICQSFEENYYNSFSSLYCAARGQQQKWSADNHTLNICILSVICAASNTINLTDLFKTIYS